MPRWLKAVGWTLGVAVTVALACFGMLFLAVERTAETLPPYDQMRTAPTGRTVRIHAADGTVLQTLGPAYGEWIPYARIPAAMRSAIVSIEDRRFRSHWGVDPRALARVTWLAWKYRGTNKRLQGASTITQQAARTVFLSQRYDVRRKFKEMLIALAMERRLDKDRILELYLNRVYLGGGAYGIDAASRKFFGHPATSLTVPEAALLAGLAKAPSDYAPSADTEASYARMRVVVSVMRETGAIDAATARSATSAKPAFAADAVPQGNGARYFTDWVTPQINAIAGDALGTIDAWTTYDPRLQADADAAVSAGVPKGAQGALVSLDSDGAVRAMVGGTDYQTSSYNRATQASRQPGSSFKLFVYLTALENGYTPDTPVTDAPITIQDWSPRNSNGGFAGTLPLRSAFAQSLNTVAARLGQAVGIEAIARTARRFGFSTRINIDPAMVLGTSEAHLIDMTRAYASIASGGVAVLPYGISRISVNGGDVYVHRTASQLLTAPRVSQDMTDMLRGAVATGTGRAADIGRPVAGKTGTTTSGKDGLFIGFSSGITTGVWIGRDDAKPIPSLQGGRAPARIFAQYMAKAVADRDPDRVESAVVETGDDVVHDGEKASPPRRPTVDDDDAEGTEDLSAPFVRTPDGRSRAVPLDEGE
jgi:penicillin-binding protein 1A